MKLKVTRDGETWDTTVAQMRADNAEDAEVQARLDRIERGESAHEEVDGCAMEPLPEEEAEEEQWWQIRLPNGTPYYGYGTQAEADRLASLWSRAGRGEPGTVYYASPCDDYDESKRDDGCNLADEKEVQS